MVPIPKAQSQTGPIRMQFDEHMGLTQGFIRDRAYEQNKFPISTIDGLGLIVSAFQLSLPRKRNY